MFDCTCGSSPRTERASNAAHCVSAFGERPRRTRAGSAIFATRLALTSGALQTVASPIADTECACSGGEGASELRAENCAPANCASHLVALRHRHRREHLQRKGMKEVRRKRLWWRRWQW